AKTLRDPQVQTFPASLRQIVEQSLEGVGGLAVATNYQTYYALGTSAVEGNDICVHVRYRLIEKLLIILDRHFPEQVCGLVREAHPTREVSFCGSRLCHDIVRTQFSRWEVSDVLPLEWDSEHKFCFFTQRAVDGSHGPPVEQTILSV